MDTLSRRLCSLRAEPLAHLLNRSQYPEDDPLTPRTALRSPRSRAAASTPNGSRRLRPLLTAARAEAIAGYLRRVYKQDSGKDELLVGTVTRS